LDVVTGERIEAARDLARIRIRLETMVARLH